MTNLTDFLWGHIAKTPFSWGKNDCLLTAADWVLDQTGIDPAASYRGKYQDFRGAHRIIKRAGGVEALVSAEMERAGFVETNSPDYGDVGLVCGLVVNPSSGAETFTTVGAICYGPMWIFRVSERQISIMDIEGLYEVVKCWHVPSA